MRFFSLQVSDARLYKNRAQLQQNKGEETVRGDIYIQNREGELFLVATTKSFLRIYAVPSKIPSDKDREIAQKIVSLLKIPEDGIIQKLSQKSDTYEVLGERIPIEDEKKLKESLASYLSEGVVIERYRDRFYPYNELASHVIGFLGFNEGERRGVYGIEQFYEKELSGGADIVLTLDLTLQQRTRDFLTKLMDKWKSPAGSVIIMRPQDGVILAMASKPDFDPNSYNETKDFEYFLNPAVQKVFEPGSIMKPITIAGGIEIEKVSPATTYEDKGFVEKSGHTIRNAGNRVFGKRTVREVLAFSINTGAVFVEDLMGNDNFLRTLENFGFGQATGIDLPGELVGDITNLDKGRPINYATASFGQGIATTPLQVINALAAIAYEGKLMRPHVAQFIFYPDGEKKEIKAQERRRAISPKTASQMVSMMINAVQEGYSKKAGVPGYLVAGKTGTAQIPGSKGEYLDQTIHSVVGFAPAFDRHSSCSLNLMNQLVRLLRLKASPRSFQNLHSSFYNTIMFFPKLPKKNDNKGKIVEVLIGEDLTWPYFPFIIQKDNHEELF